MYIPVWLLILLAILGYFYYKHNNPKSKTKRLENVSKFIYSRIAASSKTPEIEGALQRTEKMYITLRNHFNSDWGMQLELVRDWCDYCDAIRKFQSAREIYSAIIENGATETYMESTKLTLIKKEEIETKFKTLLKNFRQEPDTDWIDSN